MFKKIAGLFLAAAVMCSSAAITASAAEAEDDAAVAAADQSGEVSADGSSEVSAAASSEVEAGNVVKFDVKKSGWNNVKSVFCHIWKADGSGDWPAWQSKKEKCKYDSSTGIATYDLSKTGNTISKSDGRVYCVVFSANTGMQSYNAIMSGKCIGDTLYCTGNQLENPEDSEKKANEAKWENNSDCGPEKKITSTGNIIGSAFPEGESDATYLVAYYNDEAKTSFTQKLLDELKVSPTQVMGAVTDRLNATKNPDKDTIAPAVEKILAGCTDPTTGKKVDKTQLDNAKKTGAKAAAGSSSNGSSSSSSNGGSSSSGSGSSSTGAVKSGVETTIVFVMAGLMVSAAGVMFLARKKKED